MPTVYFEPIGEEIECVEDEIVLDVAFRQSPPPMIDALVEELTTVHGFEETDIAYDKVTTSVSE